MGTSERPYPQCVLKKNSKLVSFCRIIMLALILGGCANFPPTAQEKTPPSSLPRPQETFREFPEFVAVIAQEEDTFSSLSAKYLKDPSWGLFLSEFNESEFLIPGQPIIIPLKPDNRGGLTLRGYQTVPVLSYQKFSRTESSGTKVSLVMFEQQMRLLKEKGYGVISMDQLFDFLEFKSTIPPKSVVLTIEDGSRSAYEIGFPILKKYGYPATLFIYSDMIIDTPQGFSWDLLREMASHGIDIQCQTKNHRNPVKKESFKDYFTHLEKDLSACKRLIKKELNKEVKYFAYPYGDTNPLAIELAKKLGYRGAFTIEGQSNPFFIHNYRVNHFKVRGDFGLRQFERNLITFQDEPLR